MFRSRTDCGPAGDWMLFLMNLSLSLSLGACVFHSCLKSACSQTDTTERGPTNVFTSTTASARSVRHIEFEQTTHCHTAHTRTPADSKKAGERKFINKQREITDRNIGLCALRRARPPPSNVRIKTMLGSFVNDIVIVAGTRKMLLAASIKCQQSQVVQYFSAQLTHAAAVLNHCASPHTPIFQ